MEDGAAEGAETLPYFTVNSTAVPAYDAFCSAPVRCGKCLPGSRDVHLLTASLTALETVSGPGYRLITSMPMVWSVVLCVEVGFLGAMRAVCCVSRDGRCTPYSRAPPV